MTTFLKGFFMIQLPDLERCFCIHGSDLGAEALPANQPLSWYGGDMPQRLPRQKHGKVRDSFLVLCTIIYALAFCFTEPQFNRCRGYQSYI